MLKRLIFLIILIFYSRFSFAHQSCVNVQIGSTPIFQGNQLVGYNPIFRQDCTWYYAAIAIDPRTRTTSYVYNYTDIRAAENYVQNNCGSSCVWMSTSDVAYIALSEDGAYYGTSTRSAADAINNCGSADCDWAIMTGTGAPATTHSFGALAYNTRNNQSGSAWNYFSASSAKTAALGSCKANDCWAYAFDTIYAAMARNDEGRLFAKGDQSLGKTIRSAMKYCKDEGKSDTCKIVSIGNKFQDMDDNEKKSSIDKALSANMLQRMLD